MIDAANYRKRVEGRRIHVFRIKEITLVSPLQLPVKDGAVESLPEEIAETKLPLGHVPSIAEQASPGQWDHIPVELVPAGRRQRRHNRALMNSAS